MVRLFFLSVSALWGRSVFLNISFLQTCAWFYTVQYTHLHYEKILHSIIVLTAKPNQNPCHQNSLQGGKTRRITDKQHVEADEKAWIYKIRAIPYIIICKIFLTFSLHKVQLYQPLLLNTSSVVDHILVGSDPESGSDPTRIWSGSCF